MWLKKPRILKKAFFTGSISFFMFLIGLPIFSAQAQNNTETRSQWATRNRFDDSSQHALDLKWQFKASGSSLSEGTTTSRQISNQQLFESKLNLESKYWLSDQVSFDLEPSIKFQTGRLQALDGANAPSNSLGLRKAAVQWLPTSYIWFSAGALNQAELHSYLVADELPFPGARITLKNSFSNWDLRWVAESSIPSSNSLKTGTNQVESVPVKNAAQMQVHWQPKSYLYSRNRIGYFSYQNLPSEVAEASSLIGNTTTRLTDNQWAFNYKYQGFEASTDWHLPIASRVDLLISATAAQNQSAPANLNTGYSASTGLRYLMSSRHDLEFGGRYFHVDPDTAPAFYSNYQNFRTNRVGYTAMAKWHLKKQKFAVSALYSEAQVLFADPSQSRIRGFEIRLETDYESI